MALSLVVLLVRPLTVDCELRERTDASGERVGRVAAAAAAAAICCCSLRFFVFTNRIVVSGGAISSRSNRRSSRAPRQHFGCGRPC